MKIESKLKLTLACTVLLTLVMGAYAYRQIDKATRLVRSDIPRIEAELKRASTLQRLAYDIRYYDEVLTQSARNYAFTRDKFWEERYRKADPELDRIIKEAIALGSGEDWQVQYFQSIDKANQILLGMEYEALARTGADDSKGAVEILEGEAYANWKAIYSRGLITYVEKRREFQDSKLTQLRELIRDSNKVIATSLGLIAVVFLGFALGIAVVGNVILRSISIPINRLIRYISRVGSGEEEEEEEVTLDARIRESGDEFSDFAKALDAAIQKLKESEKINRLIIETANDAFISIDASGRILEWNRQAVANFGWRADEVFGKDLAETIIPEAYRESHHTGIKKYLATGEGPVLNRRIELTALHRTGRLFPVELTVWPVQTDHEIRFNAFVRDISERKASEEKLHAALYEAQKANQDLQSAQKQLVQADRLAAIGQLAAGVAHEINNPIGFVTSNINTLSRYAGSITRYLSAVQKLREAILEGKGADELRDRIGELEALEKELGLGVILEDIDPLLQESKGGLDRVRKIVADLKAFASTGSPEAMAVEDLNEVIEGAINIVWNELKYKVTLKKDLGSIPGVSCNAQQLGQVFINILVNAAQAIADRGEITVRSFMDSGRVCVEIADNGSGMTPEVMENIFNPFFTTKEVGKGTGLGLSISYDIVKKHGGRITVSSALGKGTAFLISVPPIHPV